MAGFEDVRVRSGVDVEYRRSGSLEVAFDGESAAHLRRTGATVGAERCAWLDSAGARQLEPALAAAVAGALSVPGHGYVSAPDLTAALARVVVRWRRPRSDRQPRRGARCSTRVR